MFVIGVLKVSIEVKATHLLNESPTDKEFVTGSPEDSYQYAFSALLTRRRKDGGNKAEAEP